MNYKTLSGIFLIALLTLSILPLSVTADNITINRFRWDNERNSIAVDQGENPEMQIIITSHEDFTMRVSVINAQGRSVATPVNDFRYHSNDNNPTHNVNTEHPTLTDIETQNLPEGEYTVRLTVNNGAASAVREITLNVNEEEEPVCQDQDRDGICDEDDTCPQDPINDEDRDGDCG